MTDPDIAAVRDFMLEGGDEPAAIAALARVEARLEAYEAALRVYDDAYNWQDAAVWVRDSDPPRTARRALAGKDAAA